MTAPREMNVMAPGLRYQERRIGLSRYGAKWIVQCGKCKAEFMMANKAKQAADGQVTIEGVVECIRKCGFRVNVTNGVAEDAS